MSQFPSQDTSPFVIDNLTRSVTASIILRNSDGREVGPLQVSQVIEDDTGGGGGSSTNMRAQFSQQSPYKNQDDYEATVFYDGDEPTIKWGFTYIDNMTWAITGSGTEVNDVITFGPQFEAGLIPHVDVYRRDASGNDSLVETLTSAPYEYTIQAGDTGFSLVAKQRLTSSNVDGAGGNEFLIVEEVLNTVAQATWFGELLEYQTGLKRWRTEATTGWDNATSFDLETLGDHVFIYKDKIAGLLTPTLVTTTEGETPADTWIEQRPDAGIKVTITSNQTPPLGLTNGVLVARDKGKVGGASTKWVGFTNPLVEGGDASEIGDGGSWNWNSGDTVKIELFGVS